MITISELSQWIKEIKENFEQKDEEEIREISVFWFIEDLCIDIWKGNKGIYYQEKDTNGRFENFIIRLENTEQLVSKLKSYDSPDEIIYD